MGYSYMTYLPVWFFIFLGVLIVWTLFWKAAGMWHAAKKKDLVWFFILLIFNTAGILDLIYLFVIEKVKPEKLFK